MLLRYLSQKDQRNCEAHFEMTDSTQHQGPDQLLPSTSHVAWKLDQAVKLRATDEEIASDPPISVVTTFKKVAEKYPDRIALVDSNSDVEDIYTYKRYYESVTHVAKAFIKLGLESSHGVGIVGFNSPQWFLSYFGAIFAGGVTAGFSYKGFGKFVAHLAVDAKCNIMIVGDDDLLQGVLEMADGLPNLKAIIHYKGQPKEGSRKIHSWSEIMNMNVDDCEDELKRRIMNIAPNKCCSLITSAGTTGKPKWIMHSHDSMFWAMKNFINFINEKKAYPPDVMISFHDLYAFTAVAVDLYWPLLCNGGTVYFVKRVGLERMLIETLKRARPTIFVGFPYIYELIMNSFLDTEECKSIIKEYNLSWSVKDNQQKLKVGNNEINKSKPVNGLKKLASCIGLDRCRFASVGGKTCKQEVYEFFLSLGIPLVQLYAMTETGCITTNLTSSINVNSAGHVIPRIHLKFKPTFCGENTEICLYGRNIFMGYLSNEQLNKKVFDEEMWFHTSDMGKLDENGMLTLVGRVDDVIIQSDNRTIFPLPIEKMILEQMPCLSHCVVVGEDKAFLNVLLVFKTKVDPESGETTDFLDQEALDWCRNLGVNTEKLSDLASLKDGAIAEEIQKVIDKTNDRALAEWEMIHKWKIIPRDFSVTGGELAGMMKLKRNAINQLYRKEILEFYN